MSVRRAMSPARAPGGGPRPGSLALGPKAPRTPPQPIHLGPHGGYFLRQACQGRSEPIQLLGEGSAQAAELGLQTASAGAWRWGAPAAKPAGQQPQRAALAGLREVASRGFPLKPKQGHGVRVHGLSEAFSPPTRPLRHPPQLLRPGFRWDRSGSGLRTRMPVPRASEVAARLPATPRIRGQDKPRTGS